MILVSDTSVLIDLERGQLLEAMFASGLALVVPDVLYQAELEEHNGQYLRTLGLGVLTLNAEEMSLAQVIFFQSKPKLSFPDSCALVCAHRADHILMAGDAALRAAAEGREITVRGLLWTLDQIEAHGKINIATLHAALSQIAAHPRCRLPKTEVTTRLEKWTGLT